MPPYASPRPIVHLDTGRPGGELPLSPSQFDFLRQLALGAAGIVIADYKRSMVYRRLWRRLAALGLKDFDAYCALLAGPAAAGEMQHLINALTTNKTEFFRENHHFEHLAATALPAIIEAGTARTKRLRLWSAGCSSGQEAYSLAMVLKRTVADLARYDARILATDIDTDMLARAERGHYAASEIEAVPAAMRGLFFQNVPGDSREFRAASGLRSLIAFRPLNLHDEWPMKGPFDAIFCRNVAIYFDKPAQHRLFDRFASIMAPGGFLYIGHSESLFRVSARFLPAGQNIYRKIA